jgi:hypothetical protein
MRRALSPVPRSMSRDERRVERRFLWKVLVATIGLQLVGGMLAVGVVPRGARPRPRLSGSPPVARVPFDAQAQLR